MKKNKIMVCTQCGSDQIQVKTWIHANTRNIIDFDWNQIDLLDVYCPECGNYTRAEDKKEYIDTCFIGLHDYEKTDHETLRKMLISSHGPVSENYPTSEMIDALDDESACDIYRRMSFLETLKLAYQQQLDLLKTEPTECVVWVRHEGEVHCLFNERYHKTPLAATIPNKARMYKNVQEFKKEIMNTQKVFLITDLMMLSNDELPF